MEIDDSYPPPAKRSAVPSSDNPDKPSFGKPSYNGVIAGKVSSRKKAAALSTSSFYFPEAQGPKPANPSLPSPLQQSLLPCRTLDPLRYLFCFSLGHAKTSTLLLLHFSCIDSRSRIADEEKRKRDEDGSFGDQSSKPPSQSTVPGEILLALRREIKSSGQLLSAEVCISIADREGIGSLQVVIDEEVENGGRKLAARVALKQDLAAAQQDLRHLSVIAGKAKSERDAEVREVYERALKLDAEIRGIDSMGADLAQTRANVQKLEEELNTIEGGDGGVEKFLRNKEDEAAVTSMV